MAKLPCYVNQLKRNPLDNQPQLQNAVKRWIWQNGMSQGKNLAQTLNGANDFFFSGQGKTQWLEELFPKKLTNELRRNDFDARIAVANARTAQTHFGKTTFGRAMETILSIPRAEKVIGHFGVFMESHAGDLKYQPLNWAAYFKGLIGQFTGVGSRAATERYMAEMERDPLYSFALKRGIDVNVDPTAGGFLSGGFKGPSLRAWLAGLTVARFNLFKGMMNRQYRVGMSQADVDSLGTSLAEVANHATGSGKGAISRLGANILFGPKLTDAKFARITTDPVKTVGTFFNWKNATVGERAAAWERLWGATQYGVMKLGSLYVNQGLLHATGSDQKVNFNDPLTTDFWKYKGFGLEMKTGMMDPELRLLGSMIQASYIDQKELAKKMYADIIKQRTGMSRTEAEWDLAFNYARSKLQPGIGLGADVLTRENWQGRPIDLSLLGLPAPTEGKKPVSLGEYTATQLPIIAEGPAKFVYDQFKDVGMSGMDAMKTVKSLFILGAGSGGAHVTEDKPKVEYTPKRHRKSLSKSGEMR